MVKQLRGVQLPLIAGRDAVIFLENGAKARTYPKKINEVRYNRGFLYVTFTTTHSIYMAPIKVIEGPQNPVEEQLIKEGSEVWNSEGGKEYIDGIVDIKDTGIGVRTRTGIFNGKIKLEQYKPE